MDALIPATQRHAIYLGRHLRDGCAKLMIGQQRDPRKVFVMTILNSPDAMTWMRDTRIMGIGGIAGTTVGTEGFAWIGLTKEGMANPIALFRLMLPGLRERKERWARLVASVDSHDAIAMRFAERLGFFPCGMADERGMINFAWERS